MAEIAEMRLGEKLRRLRAAEGLRRGLWRPLTQREIVRALRQELGVTLSQAYLSQLESGARVHLSHATREALARFYHIYPTDLVSDVASDATSGEAARAVDQAGDAAALARLARALQRAPDPERALRLIERVVALEPEALGAVESALPPALDAAPHDRADLEDSD
jgi:transcriptional regulator with XRE-family HTH domain